MGRLPPQARAYLLLVLAIAGVLLVRLNPFSPLPEFSALQVAGVVGLGLILADTHQVELSHTTKLSVSTALEFALLLTLSPGLAIWTIALSVALTGPWHLRRAWKWYNLAFYAANGVISVGTAGMVYHRIASGYALLSSPESVLAVLLAGAVYFALNVGNVAAIVALARTSDSLGSFMSAFQVAAPQFVGLLALGVVAAAVNESSPPSALLLAIPLLGVYFSLRSALTLRGETKRAIETLALEVDQYHHYTAEHSQQVARYSERIARRMRLSEVQVETIVRAASIHDLGKLSIWRGMLDKPTRLTDEEMREVRTHPSRGAELVSKFPDYRSGRDLILYHHERYDGLGYPEGLKGDLIPLGARIIAVADSTDAMLSDRPYRKALGLPEAMRELERNRGTQFDPMVLDLMLSLLEEDARAQERVDLAQAGAPA